MAYSTANWHWKNKTVTPWAKEWFERELVTVQVQGEDGAVVSVERVAEVDGDVELGRRKSKLISIYDCKVVLHWKGRTADGTEATGKLTIPEVSHEVTLDGISDYVYQWSLTSPSSPATTALFALAKEKLPTALETKFAAFPVDLIDTHGKDIIVGSNEPSRNSSPAPPSSTAVPANNNALKKATSPQKINVSVVEVEATFHASGMTCFPFSRTTNGSHRGVVRQPRAQLIRVQTSSCLAVACGANTFPLLPERRSSRPGHCKVRPGRVNTWQR